MFPFTRNNRPIRTTADRKPILVASTPLTTSYSDRRKAAIATGRLCKSQAATIIERTAK